jgi:hypothetical protein
MTFSCWARAQGYQHNTSIDTARNRDKPVSLILSLIRFRLARDFENGVMLEVLVRFESVSLQMLLRGADIHERLRVDFPRGVRPVQVFRHQCGSAVRDNQDVIVRLEIMRDIVDSPAPGSECGSVMLLIVIEIDANIGVKHRKIPIGIHDNVSRVKDPADSAGIRENDLCVPAFLCRDISIDAPRDRRLDSFFARE